MFRYLAFVWHDEDAAARDTARRLMERHSSHTTEWQVALRAKGLFVGYAGARVGSSEPHCLHGAGGVVLGKLFERPSSTGPSIAAPLALDETRSRQILESRGRHLIDRYWGRYVAILNNAAAGNTSVLRDPTAGLPCLTLRFGGVRIYFSSMSEIGHLGLGPFEVNWGYVAACLCMMRGQTHATGLREVSQVLGGECVELHDDRASSTFYWDGVEIAKSNVIEDPVEATQALRDCVIDAVRAWASCYRGIALSLSGGLDSSIVYCALRDSPAKEKLSCFHYYPLGSDMDERHFARLVAHSGGSELIERARDSNLDLKPLLEIEATHEPGFFLHYLECGRLEAQLAAERGATAVFTGLGGDQLFYQSFLRFGVEDYLHDKGLRPELLRIALDSAREDRISVWRVLREALAAHFQQARWNLGELAAQYRPLLRPEVIREVYQSALFTHPLLRNDRGIPGGKLWHATQLSTSLESADPFRQPDDPERVAPLYSQPVLELCLRLPVYILTQGGWDRALARRAFYGELPREIANRRPKGTIERHIWTIFEHNRAFLRELLLDGALVREGIVDRKKLAGVLSGRASALQLGSAELLDFVGTEAWLRCWRNQGWRAAA